MTRTPSWAFYRAAGYKIVRECSAHGYVPVGADPDQAPVKRGRYGLYFEKHHPTHRAKVIRCYIEREDT